MRISTPTELRNNLAAMMDAVVNEADALIIHRGAGREDVVMIPFSEWAGQRATDELLRTPANADRLRRAAADMNADRSVEHDRIGPDA